MSLKGYKVPDKKARKLTLDEATNCVATINMDEPHLLAVGQLNGGKFFIILPEGMDREVMIRVILQWVWNFGYMLEPWTQLVDGQIIMPRFKL
jgi:hypothetical protein